MGKRLPSKRIGEIVTAIGSPKPPALGDIKNDLMGIVPDVEALEAKFGLPQLAQENESLTTELDVLRAKIAKSQQDIQRLEAEAKEREEKDVELPEQQIRILSCLNPQSGQGMTPEGISKLVNLPLGDVEVHLSKLSKLGLAVEVESGWGPGPGVWKRLLRGNEYVMAKRLAGELESEKGRQNHPIQYSGRHELVLMFLTNGNYGTSDRIANSNSFSRDRTDIILADLKAAGLVNSFYSPSEEGMAMGDDGPEYWALTMEGKQYLLRRDLLKDPEPPF